MIRMEQNISKIRKYIVIGIIMLLFIAGGSILSLTGIMMSITHVSASVQMTNEYADGKVLAGAGNSSKKEFVINDGLLVEYKGKNKKVVIPEGVTGIDSYAFEKCTFMTELVLPKSLTEIDFYSFQDCVNLKKITVRKGNKYFSVDKKGVLFDKKKTKVLYCPLKIAGKYTIPNGVEIVTENAFDSCNRLTEMVLPDSIIRIEAGAFSNCRKLRKVTIPEGVTEVESGAFFNCVKLKNIIFPDTVTKIGYGIFSGCKGLKNVKLPAGLTFLNSNLFDGCSGLKEIVIPDTVESIGVKVFKDCSGLKEIVIPKGVKSIIGGQFPGCTNLEKIIVEEGNKYFTTDEHGALFNEKMTVLYSYPAKAGNTYIVPETVKRIKTGAFACNPKLDKVKLPEGLITIEFQSFSRCTNLKNLEIPDGVVKIGKNAFYGCKKITLIVAKDSYAKTYAKKNKLAWKYRN